MIIQLLNDIKTDNINISIVERFHRSLLDKNATFSLYSTWAQDIIHASQITNLKNFSSCESILNKNHNDLLYKNLNKYCYLRFINLYAKIQNKSYKKHENILEKHLAFFLNPIHEEFLNFLQRIKKRGDFYRMVTDKVLKFYTGKSISVNAKILPHIRIAENIESRISNQKKMVKLAQKIQSPDASLSETKNNLNLFINIPRKNYDNIDHNFTRTMLITMGRRLLAREQYALAKTCFKESLAFTSSLDYDDSLFLYLWPDILNKKHLEVDKTITSLGLYKKFDDLNSRLKFWIAYNTERLGKKKLAQQYYDTVVHTNPISYYSIMSIKRLKKISPNSQGLSIETLPRTKEAYSTKPLSSHEYSNNMLNALKRIKVFTKLGHTDLVAHEIKYIPQSSIEILLKNRSQYSTQNDEELKDKMMFYVASMLHQDKNYLNSFLILHGGVKIGMHNINPALLKTIFPTPYLSQVKKIIGSRVDPYIILSLIRQESAFNPAAKSPVGARGLMQLMPSTAKSITRRLSTKSLYNPKINLTLGIRYFIKLYKKYNKNLIYTLSAYNAGPHRVRRWEKEYFKDHSTLHVIESIPIKETNLYVKLIFRNLFFYKLINGYKNDSDMHNKIFDILITKN